MFLMGLSGSDGCVCVEEYLAWLVAFVWSPGCPGWIDQEAFSASLWEVARQCGGKTLFGLVSAQWRAHLKKTMGQFSSSEFEVSDISVRVS